MDDDKDLKPDGKMTADDGDEAHPDFDSEYHDIAEETFSPEFLAIMKRAKG